MRGVSDEGTPILPGRRDAAMPHVAVIDITSGKHSSGNHHGTRDCTKASLRQDWSSTVSGEPCDDSKMRTMHVGDILPKVTRARASLHPAIDPTGVFARDWFLLRDVSRSAGTVPTPSLDDLKHMQWKPPIHMPPYGTTPHSNRPRLRGAIIIPLDPPTPSPSASPPARSPRAPFSFSPKLRAVGNASSNTRRTRRESGTGQPGTTERTTPQHQTHT